MTTDSVPAHNDLIARLRRADDDESDAFVPGVGHMFGEAADEIGRLSSLLATARADGDVAEWEGIDTSQSPTLAAAREAATFGIRLSSTEAAYIAEAVIAASGLRTVVPLTTEEKS